ncbi:MAG TPA: DUF3616 domain-containing protein [Kofleriaceae bacterium]|nr:DUF3616 domain-containing protein [Kofleriaceae bacterium]
MPLPRTPAPAALVALWALAAPACSSRSAGTPPPPDPGQAAQPASEEPAAPAPAAPAASGPWRISAPIVFRGACDASGGVGLAGGRIAVADDEDNRLRIYDAAAGGRPVEVIDTRPQMADARGKHPEMDLEGTATIGTRVYFIASHGRKKSGKLAPARLRLFAADVVHEDGVGSLTLVGTPYSSLLEDLTEAPALARFGLARAKELPPDEPGGLNIEGLTDSPDGHLVLGFRNPVPNGKALLVPIENPAAMIDRGEPAQFGAPVELDLGGRGIRSVATWDGAYWIVGGTSVAPPLEPRLYRWDGRGEPEWLRSVDFGDLNPEAIATVTVGGRTGLLLLSDDGLVPIGERPCKKLKDDEAKRFRGVWLEKKE